MVWPTKFPNFSLPVWFFDKLFLLLFSALAFYEMSLSVNVVIFGYYDLILLWSLLLSGMPDPCFKLWIIIDTSLSSFLL